MQNVGTGNANFAKSFCCCWGQSKTKTDTKKFSSRELESKTLHVTLSHCKSPEFINLFLNFTLNIYKTPNNAAGNALDAADKLSTGVSSLQSERKQNYKQRKQRHLSLVL